MSRERSSTSRPRSKSTRSRMATPRSTSSKSTKRTSAKSSAARAELSEVSEPSSKPPPRAKAPESTSTSSKGASDSVGASQQPDSSSAAAQHAPQFLVVAQVLGAHGIRGELKCRIVTDFPSRRFKRGNTVLISGEPHKIQGARVQGGTVLLKLEDVSDRDLAAALRGAEIEVPTEQAVSLPKGQFYWHQVIGLRVEDATS